MPTMLVIIGLVVFIVVTAAYMSYKSEKDRRLYQCYLRMTYKDIASVTGCQGTGTPECKHCYYYKLYLKEKGTNK